MKIFVTVGIPASGKTTWANEYIKANPNGLNVNRDDIRQELFGPFKWGEYVFTNDKEQAVTDRQINMVMNHAASGDSGYVIISDTNISQKTRDMWASIAKENNFELEYKVFNITLKEAIRRDRIRDMPVGEKVIRDMLQRFLPQCKDLIVESFKKELEAIWNEPTADYTPYILVDMDGTVADMRKGEAGSRGPFDWSRVGEDTPRKTVLSIVRLMADAGHDVVFFSGRDVVCQPQTASWLNKHYYTPTDPRYLIMRDEGDMRPDWIVKLEKLVHVSNWYKAKPVCMFDDRNQVVEVMRAVGVEVLQVQPGDF